MFFILFVFLLSNLTMASESLSTQRVLKDSVNELTQVDYNDQDSSYAIKIIPHAPYPFDRGAMLSHFVVSKYAPKNEKEKIKELNQKIEQEKQQFLQARNRSYQARLQEQVCQHCHKNICAVTLYDLYMDTLVKKRELVGYNQSGWRFNITQSYGRDLGHRLVASVCTCGKNQEQFGKKAIDTWVAQHCHYSN